MNNASFKPEMLKGRIILVTGAGDGIGAATAKTYAKYGATIILLGRTVSKLEKVYDEIENQGSPKPAIYPLNLEGATQKDYVDLATIIEKEFGQLHGLLHNAAILGDMTPIHHYDIKLWHRVMQTNLTAPFMLTSACVELLKKSESPRVTFTSQLADSAYWGAYGVSKAAADRLMTIMADELHHEPIYVNSISPGEVQSPMTARAYPGKDISQLLPIESIMPAYLMLMDPLNTTTGKIFDATTGKEALPEPA